ncbi:MAG: hypothetical protein RL030_734, partial [Pseudomonadota bacterium]
WEDEPTAQVILAAQELGSRLLLGPGSHCIPPPGIDFAGEVRAYFDDHLKPEAAARTADPAPRVTWWLQGAPRGQEWQRGAQWPGAAMKSERWLLSASPVAGEGRLLQKKAAKGAAPFRVNYDVGAGEYFAFWVESQHGKGVSFTGPAFERERLITGFPVVQLALQSDRPEPLLFAYLEGVAPDGSAKVMAYGRLAAAYRKEGKAPYGTLGLPWLGGLSADFAPLRSGETAQLHFALTPVAQVIPAGTRLRLVVTGADPRQRNLQQIRLDPPPLITVRTGTGSGSFIDLPLADRLTRP